jgi:hypothetical protein
MEASIFGDASWIRNTSMQGIKDLRITDYSKKLSSNNLLILKKHAYKRPFPKLQSIPNTKGSVDNCRRAL